MGGVSTADSENGKGQKFFQGVKDHFFVAVVSSDWAIMGSSGVQCGCRNALSLHCSILLHIVEDSIFSIFLLRTFPPVSFIIFSFDEHSSGLEVLQAKSAALLRTKFCAWEGDSCSYYPRLKAVFRTISKLRFNLMQSGPWSVRKLRLSWYSKSCDQTNNHRGAQAHDVNATAVFQFARKQTQSKALEMVYDRDNTVVVSTNRWMRRLGL